MKRVLGVAVLAATVATGCNGFPKPIPWKDAEFKAEKYQTYWAQSEVPFTFGQQRWLLLPGAVSGVPASTFQAAGGGAVPLLRIVWDDPPYDQLYSRAADGLLHIAGEIR